MRKAYKNIIMGFIFMLIGVFFSSIIFFCQNTAFCTPERNSLLRAPLYFGDKPNVKIKAGTDRESIRILTIEAPTNNSRIDVAKLLQQKGHVIQRCGSIDSAAELLNSQPQGFGAILVITGEYDPYSWLKTLVEKLDPDDSIPIFVYTENLGFFEYNHPGIIREKYRNIHYLSNEYSPEFIIKTITKESREHLFSSFGQLAKKEELKILANFKEFPNKPLIAGNISHIALNSIFTYLDLKDSEYGMSAFEAEAMGLPVYSQKVWRSRGLEYLVRLEKEGKIPTIVSDDDITLPFLQKEGIDNPRALYWQDNHPDWAEYSIEKGCQLNNSITALLVHYPTIETVYFVSRSWARTPKIGKLLLYQEKEGGVYYIKDSLELLPSGKSEGDLIREVKFIIAPRLKYLPEKDFASYIEGGLVGNLDLDYFKGLSGSPLKLEEVRSETEELAQIPFKFFSVVTSPHPLKKFIDEEISFAYLYAFLMEWGYKEEILREIKTRFNNYIGIDPGYTMDYLIEVIGIAEYFQSEARQVLEDLRMIYSFMDIDEMNKKGAYLLYKDYISKLDKELYSLWSETFPDNFTSEMEKDKILEKFKATRSKTKVLVDATPSWLKGELLMQCNHTLKGLLKNEVEGLLGINEATFILSGETVKLDITQLEEHFLLYTGEIFGVVKDGRDILQIEEYATKRKNIEEIMRKLETVLPAMILPLREENKVKIKDFIRRKLISIKKKIESGQIQLGHEIADETAEKPFIPVEGEGEIPIILFPGSFNFFTIGHLILALETIDRFNAPCIFRLADDSMLLEKPYTSPKEERRLFLERVLECFGSLYGDKELLRLSKTYFTSQDTSFEFLDNILHRKLRVYFLSGGGDTFEGSIKCIEHNLEKYRGYEYPKIEYIFVERKGHPIPRNVKIPPWSDLEIHYVNYSEEDIIGKGISSTALRESILDMRLLIQNI
ncbi:MAG: nucleotidyl transferase family protein [Planctomycetota bacterium]|jgi:hypothetical protein